MKIFKTLLLCFLLSSPLMAENVIVTQTSEGGVSAITIEGDTTQMNWILSSDGTQYKNITAEYQWGLGTLNVNGKPCAWTKATKTNQGTSVFSVCDNLILTVKRERKGEDFVETYTFRNTGKQPLRLTDIEVNTPFNDNYPDAKTCVGRRCHAHIWAAGTAGYVCAMRMGAYAPHLGLMMTSGSLQGYSIKERDQKKGSSNTRGVICLDPSDASLAPGKTYTFSWRIFPHMGMDDFYAQMLKRGGIQCTADRYVAQKGEKFTITLRTQKGTTSKEYMVDKTGDIRIPIKYKEGETWVELLGISNYDSIIQRRADFMLDYQQYNHKGDKRDGALLPYDNTTDSIYCNWLQSQNLSDANEGRERVGGGIFLAYLATQTHSDRYLHALDRYCKFVRTQLQDENFNTWSDADKDKSRIGSKTQRRRIYNYPWITHLYCQMYEATHDKKYLHWAYGTQKACYRNGGYNFYAIDVPVVQSITLMRENGMQAEADTLLGEYRKMADNIMKNGLDYPKSEVNYEQSIVAPSVNFLCKMYLVTKEQKYLDKAQEMMPVVEAFGGQQPSSHLHDIAIRHWDGYWFGKPKQWGDTMPHYWSCITADCFANYSKCLAMDGSPTDSQTYMARAQQILRQNLNLFTEDGRAGAAYIYPDKVNGKVARGLNPFSNDQDFALMYYLKWIK